MTKVAAVQEQRTAGDLDDRLARAEAALREALEERNRLWHDAQRVKALEQELDRMRRVLDDIQRSPSWRVTAPLRRLKGGAGTRARRYAALARKARAHIRG